MLHFVRWFLNNPFTLGTMCMTLVFVPVLGMWASTNTDGNTGGAFTKHNESPNGPD